MKRLFDLEREVGVVTGALGKLGPIWVETLLEAGARVLALDRPGQPASPEFKRVQARFGPEQLALTFADVCIRSELEAGLALCVKSFGTPTIPVNNAAIERHELLAMTSDASWDEMLDVNLGGPFRCTRAVLRRMVGRRRGAIVNIASLSALRGVAGHSSYAAAKAGLVAMTRCVAREMGRRGIRVNAVVPGYVPTDLTADLSAEAVALLRAPECLAAGVSPKNVAGVVRFLASEASSGMTGQILTVDAGTSV